MVSIENYKCFCKKSSLERFQSKEGRGFVKCSKESCTLFVPEEKYLELMDAYETKVLEKFKPNNFPKCDCNDVASLWLSYSTKNPKRPYFRCQDTDPDEKCSFFLWADSVSKLKRRKRKASNGKDGKLPKEKKVIKRVKRKIESSSDEAGQKLFSYSLFMYNKPL